VPNTVARSLDALQGLGIIKEITGKKRNRLFVYAKYFERLNQVGLV